MTQSAPDSGEMMPDEEARLREAAKKMPPAEVDKIIEHMKATRREAASYRTDPGKLRLELFELADRMRKNSAPSNLKRFREARDRLGSRIYWFEQNRVPIPPEIGNPLAETLIDAFETQTSIPDHLPITVAANHSNSRKTKDYLLGILSGDEDWKQKEVLHGLARTKFWRGDAEFFSALERLLARRGGEDTFVLGDMLVIDNERALPSLLKLLDSTMNPTVFYQVSGMVASCKRTDLLERLFRRVKEIPLTGRNLLPGLCNLPPDIVLNYIRDAEGEKLGFALDAFMETYAALKDGYPLLVTKLSSKNPLSRRVVVHCMSTLARRGTWTDHRTLADLQQHLPRETDPDVRKEAQDTVGYLETQLRFR